MSKPLKISIPTPCHQNWQEMTPDDKGRYCGACQKSIIDFTKLSDREIASRIGNDENVCGRFLKKQLDRDLQIPQEKSYGWVAAASGVLALLGSSPLVQAQTNPTAQIPPVKVYTSDNNPHTIGKVLSPHQVPRTVSGIVSDLSGTLPGANVIIRGTQIGTQTDIDGKFEIKAKQGDTLIFSYLGMTDATFVISDHLDGISIVLEEADARGDDAEIIVVAGYVTYNSSECKDRPGTFFGRVFRSIGNWFR